MKLHLVSTMPFVFLLACGGSSKKPVAAKPQPTVTVKPVQKKPPPEPEPPPPPPPPKEWHATASVAAVKGVKMPAFEIAFDQTEGEPGRAHTSGAIEKLKAGTYRLVVHEGGTCGPKGDKAGAALVDLTQDAPLVATRKAFPSVDVESSAIALDGDGSIVGKAIVLHADKRGKPGKAVACGVINAVESDGGEGDVSFD